MKKSIIAAVLLVACPVLGKAGFGLARNHPQG